MVKNLLKSALWRCLSDQAATIKSGRLFHASITRLLEKYLLASIVQFCFDILT